MNDLNRRLWKRFDVANTADIKTVKFAFTGDLNDLSGSGASIHRGLAKIAHEKIVITDAEMIDITIEDFGDFSGNIVREWEDGFAVQFDIEEDDKYALQEDLEAFMRENDLTPD